MGPAADAFGGKGKGRGPRGGGWGHVGRIPEVEDMAERGRAGPIRRRMGPYGAEKVVEDGFRAGIGDWDREGEVGLL